jgi:hypothetical protein
MDTLVVNGETYVKQQSDSPIKIAILQRGWVMVGNYSTDGDTCYLSNASVIRIWGTTKGLGEIAINGPTPSTKLDPVGTVQFHILTTVALVDCNKNAWPNI